MTVSEPPVMDEDMLRAQEELKLKEQSKALITLLGKKNIESLKKGEGRLGYEIGTGDHTVFILAAPITEDAPRQSFDNATTIVERFAHYVMVTPAGIREIPFALGHVINGKIDDLGGHYNIGEHSSVAFVAALQEHAKLFEDIYGVKKPTPPDGLSYRSIMEYAGWKKDENGHEEFTLPKNPFRASTNSHNLKTNVSPDFLPQAIEASKLLAARPRNTDPSTPAAIQAASITKAMSML